MSDTYDREITTEGNFEGDASGLISEVKQVDAALLKVEERTVEIQRNLTSLENAKFLPGANFKSIEQDISHLKAELVALKKEYQNLLYVRAGLDKDAIKGKGENFWKDIGGYEESLKEVKRRNKDIEKEIKRAAKQQQDAETLEYRTRTNLNNKDEHEESVLRGKNYNKLIREGRLQFNDVKANSLSLVDMENYYEEQRKIFRQTEKIASRREHYGVTDDVLRTILSNKEYQKQFSAEQLGSLSRLNSIKDRDIALSDADMTRYTSTFKAISELMKSLNGSVDDGSAKEVERLTKALKSASDISYRNLTQTDAAKRYDSVANGAILAKKLRNGSATIEDIKKSENGLIDLNNFYAEQKKLLKQTAEIDDLIKDVDIKNLDKSILSKNGLRGLSLLLNPKSPNDFLSYSTSEMKAIRQVGKDYKSYLEQIRSEDIATKNAQLNFDKAMSLDPNSPQAQYFLNLGKDLVLNNNGQVRPNNSLTGDEYKRDLKEQEFAIKYYSEQIQKTRKQALEDEFQQYRRDILTDRKKREELIREYKSLSPEQLKNWDPYKKRVMDEMSRNASLYNTEDFLRKLEVSEKNAETRRREIELREKGKRGKGYNSSRVISGISQFGTNISGIDDPTGLATIGGRVNQVATSVATGALYGGAAGAGIALATEGINQLSKGLVEFYNSSIMAYKGIEKLKVNLSVISGSDSQGEALFDEIAKYAIKSPFGVEATAEQATLLKQSGVYQDELMDTLKRMGDLAGGNADKMRRISNDYAMIVANGKANMIQLRQLANAGVPIYKELAREMNTTVANVRQLSKQGMITAEVVKKVIDRLTSEGGTFFQAVEKGSKTLAARTVNLEDIKNLAKSEWGDLFQNGFSNKYGADGSLRNQGISLAEDFWSRLYQWGKDLNLDKNNDSVEKNEQALIEARERLAEAEKEGRTGEVIDLKNEIAKLESAFSEAELEALSVKNDNTRKAVLKEMSEIMNSSELLDYEGWFYGRDETGLGTYKKLPLLQAVNQMMAISGQSQDYIDQSMLSTFGFIPLTRMSKAASESLEENSDYSEIVNKTADHLEYLWKRLNDLPIEDAFDVAANFSNHLTESFSVIDDNILKARNASGSISDNLLTITEKFKQSATYKFAQDTALYERLTNTQNTLKEFKNFMGGNSFIDAVSKSVSSGESQKAKNMLIQNLGLLSVDEKFNLNKGSYSNESDYYAQLNKHKSQFDLYISFVDSILSQIDNKGSSLELYASLIKNQINSETPLPNVTNQQTEKAYQKFLNTESDAYDTVVNSGTLTEEQKKIFEEIKLIRSLLTSGNVSVDFSGLNYDVDLLYPRHINQDIFQAGTKNTSNTLMSTLLGYSPLINMMDGFNGAFYTQGTGNILSGSNGSSYENTKNNIIETIRNFDKSIFDTVSHLDAFQNMVDTTIKSLESESKLIDTLSVSLTKSPKEMLRDIAGMSSDYQDTFKRYATFKKDGEVVAYTPEQLSFENGKLMVETQKGEWKNGIQTTPSEWKDVLELEGLEVDITKLINALGENKLAIEALTMEMKIDSLGNKILSSVRSDVLSTGFSNILLDTDFLNKNGLKVSKYGEGGKVSSDFTYAVNTFTNLFKELVNIPLAITGGTGGTVTEELLDKYNKEHNTNYSFDKVKDAEELALIQRRGGSNEEIERVFQSIMGRWFPDIISELNAYSTATVENRDLQPLWKRIIESNLGLNAAMFSNGGDAMRTHENEQYRRNLTKDFMSTAAKQGYGTSLITGMLSYRPGVTRNDLDGQVNKQIDWKKTNENIKNFALRIGQAAEVTSAYRQSVETEIDQLSELLASMPTTPEDFANVKNFNDAFWNAFTGELKMGDQTVWYDAQSGLITAAGDVTYALDEVKDQLSYTEYTMQELEKQLKQRHEDLAEAKRAEIRNNALQNGSESYAKTELEFAAEYRYGFKPGTAGFENFVTQGENIFKEEYKYRNNYRGTEEYVEALKNAKELDVQETENERARVQKLIDEKNESIENTKVDIKNKEKELNDVISLAKKAWYSELKNDKEDYPSYDEWNKTVYKEKYGKDHKQDNDYLEYQDFLKNNGIGSGEEYKSFDVLETDATKALKSVNESLVTLQAEGDALEKQKDSIATVTDHVLAYEKEVNNKIANFSTEPDLEKIEKQALLTDGGTFDSLSNSQYVQSRRNSFKNLADQLIYGDSELSSLSLASRDWWNDRREMSRYGATQDQLNYVNMFTDEKLRKLFTENGESARNELNLIKNGLGDRAFSVIAGTKGDDKALDQSKEWKAITDETTKATYQLMTYKKEMDGLKDSLTSTFDNFVLGQIKNSMESIGAGLREWAEETSETGQAWKNFGKNFVNATKSMTEQMGSLMVSAGLKMLIDGDKSMGIALLLAGGMNQIVSGFLKPDDDKEIDKKIEILKALKSDLKELIAQAKADAIYYEKEVSHKKALTTNQSLTKVNDAIITPSGNVINTHPDDWLIATKTPQTLGNTKTSAPVVNLSIVNNSGQQLSIKKTQTSSNGEVNIEAIIEGVVGQGIADGKFDGALAAREVRNAGRNVYM